MSSWILAFFLCVGLAFADSKLLEDLWRQKQTSTFLPVPAQVISSEVEESRNSDGTSYQAKVVYSYEVGGRAYRSDRIDYQSSLPGSNSAKAQTDAYPKGARVTAFYSPQDPAVAVLQTGFNGMELLLLMFLLPFHLAALSNILDALERGDFGPENTGTVPIEEGPREVRARLHPNPPWRAALTALGASCFGGVFLVTLGSQALPLRPLATAAWAGVLLITAWQYLRAFGARRKGRGDLVLDRSRRVLSFWPLATDGKKNPLAGQPETLSYDEVVRVGLDTETFVGSDDVTDDHYVLLVKANGEKVRLKRWDCAGRAGRFQEWLTGQLS